MSNITRYFLLWPANPKFKVDDDMYTDMKTAIYRASLNLEIRHEVKIKLIQGIIPRYRKAYKISVNYADDISFGNPGNRLRGISCQLLKINKEKYEKMKVGKRMFYYQEI